MSTNRHEATIDAFFALIRAGLWENLDEFQVSRFWFQDAIDWEEVYQLAEEQSLIGVVLAGIEHSNVKPPQELLLQWIGEVQMLEQQNKEMNSFVADLIEKLRAADIYTLLVKGQGIAQCYERPLWRACGDVDLFLSDDNYQKAKSYLLPIAELLEPEGLYKKHFEMLIDPWVVELHGSMRSGLSSRMDRVIDETQKDVFYGGNVRSWLNGKTQVFLPAVNCDVIFVFTHFIKHFYCEGLGLRQICDWCRLLWTYRSKIDTELLEKRLRKMRLVSEWKAFGAFAVEYLGMPSEAMPLYSPEAKWKKKADKISAFILEVGNMGHNRDMSYFEKYPYLIRKVCSMGRRCGDLVRHARIFPMDSLRFLPRIMFNGLSSAVRGE
jgi:hypothetical protein